MIIRAKSFESWMKSNFSAEELSDIANHGADGGWHGLTYYGDTCKLYSRFKDEIWEMLSADADDMGMNILEMIANFGGAKSVQNCQHFENLMVWYAAERIANEVANQ